MLNQYEIVDRGGIGNDQHLQAKPTVRRTIFLKVFQRVPQGDIMLFEKSVNFQACFKAQQAPHLICAQMSGLVSLYGDLFQQMTRDVLPREHLGNIIRQVNGNVHTISPYFLYR
jgi:hypothetical protein